MTLSQRFLPPPSHSRAIGPVGTTSRVLVGIALLAVGIAADPSWIAGWQLILGLVGLPAALALVQLTRLSFTSEPLALTDHLESCLNCGAITVMLVFSATRNATLVFLGASLLVAALRGYGGCESLAISNWLLRRNDQVGCLIFSPVDQLESRSISRSA